MAYTMRLFQLKNTPVSFLLFFLTLCFFSGVIGIASAMLGMPVLKVWKEALIVILFLIALLFSKGKVSSKIIIPTVILLLIGIFAIYSMLDILASHTFIIFYQLKFDIIPVMFIVAVLLIFSKMSKEELLAFSIKFVKMTLFLGALNAIAVILQQLFPDSFMGLLGLDAGQWGSDAGVRLNSTEGNIRAIGLQLSFTMSGVLMLFCMILSVECSHFIKSKTIKILLFVLFLVAIFCTTYKTAIIGVVVYFLVKFFEKFLPSISRVSIFIIGAILVLFFVYSTHDYSVYNSVRVYNQTAAYNSIYLRVLEHHKIIASLDSLEKVLFGAGLGINGTFGLDKSEYGINAIATDSAYIYLVSNYGYVGFFTYLFLLVYIQLKLFMIKDCDVFGARHLIFFTLTIELFYNLGLGNFPNNIFLVVFVAVPFVLKKKGCTREDIAAYSYK
ncbi:hypothetical protein [Serratia proteamaculans]|uniref:hypothetical protein n=1 Tax=Serratia proteamaculans TaxID=28151 RepID=UPI00217B56F2|nr:hypothetical protein [Serratia proteamaculans]CAI1722236.1 Lipid A core - O-antigen ligase and related enzymes [Serratia proteamaculans]